MNAQMIARAWLDESFRADLEARGVEVPARPEDLSDDQLNIVADDVEYHGTAPQSQTCC